MIVVVFGGRKAAYRDSYVFRVLDAYHASFGFTLLVEGGGKGTDRQAREWAISRNVPHKTCDADWDDYGGYAGPIRNRYMLEHYRPQLAIGFPGGPGTANMIKQVRERIKRGWDIDLYTQ